jgi:hypothetical protein
VYGCKGNSASCQVDDLYIPVVPPLFKQSMVTKNARNLNWNMALFYQLINTVTFDFTKTCVLRSIQLFIVCRDLDPPFLVNKTK